MAMNREELVDYIGVESNIDIRPDALDNQASTVAVRGGEMVSQRQRRSEEEKEYPPPMSWLARTENLPSHMPWVMNKHHTSDGRVLITKEKVKRHEYFETFRSNGRLVLNLVLLNDSGDADEEEEEEEKEKEEEEEEDSVERINGHDDENGGGMDASGLEPSVHT